MTDLGERSGDLARNVADLEGAPERSARPPSRATRVLTIAFALVLAIGGFAVVLGAFRHGPARTPTQDSIGPKANGVIWFRVGGGDDPSFIYEVRPDGSGERLVFGSEAEPLRYSQVAWSPDGARIAYVDPVAGSRGIYVSDPDGSDPQQLTDGANDRWPAWSPDGTKIAFSSTGHDPSAGPCTSTGDPDLHCPSDIYVMDADGSNATRLTTDPAPEYRPIWSPDGSRIAFTKTFDCCATALYVMNADTPGRSRAMRAGAASPLVGPRTARGSCSPRSGSRTGASSS